MVHYAKLSRSGIRCATHIAKLEHLLEIKLVLCIPIIVVYLQRVFSELGPTKQ